MAKGYTNQDVFVGGDQKTQIVGATGNVAEVNTEGQLHTVMRGKADTGNSTKIPLLASTAFTGTSADTLDYSAITVWVTSDVASAINGLSVQFSDDGADWHEGEVYSILAGAEKFYTPTLQNRYVRVVYTNGAIDQALFHLEVILRKSPIKWSSHNIDDPIKGEDDAELVKSVLTGQSPDGTYNNVNTTADGDLTISDNSSGLSIAQGKVSGTGFNHKFGNAPDFDTGDGEVTVWDGAEDGTAWELMNYVYSTTADIDSVSSSSASDTYALVVEGLDANYDIITQEVTLTGQTRVALPTPLIRCFRAYNNNGVEFVGHVIVYVNGVLLAGVPTDKTTIRAIIDPDNQQTEMALYTIPAGKTGYMRDWYMATAGGKKSSNYVFKVKAREFGKVFRTKHTSAMDSLAPVPYQHFYTEPEIFIEKTDIEMRVQSIASPIAEGNSVVAGFDIVLVDN